MLILADITLTLIKALISALISVLTPAIIKILLSLQKGALIPRPTAGFDTHSQAKTDISRDITDEFGTDISFDVTVGVFL